MGRAWAAPIANNACAEIRRGNRRKKDEESDSNQNRKLYVGATFSPK